MRRYGYVAQVLFMHNVAIDHEKVLPAIEVSVEEKQPKGDHAQRRRSDTGAFGSSRMSVSVPRMLVP